MLADTRFQGYSLEGLRRDVLSGIVVGIVALPLSMAFAIASGVRPEYGIYTAIIGGFLISLLGGSRYQIGGPAGAFVPVLLGIVLQYGYQNLLIAGLMAGVMLVLMGLFRLGSLIYYIPRPVVVGFTAGIAVIIFTSQIPAFLGLRGMQPQEEFLLKLKEIVVNIPTANLYSIVTALICLGLVLGMTRIFPKIPGALFGLLISAAVAAMLYPDKVATVGSVFGNIANDFPPFKFPEITWNKVLELFWPACVIALLGGIESLLCALVADNMAGSRHNSNKELVAQGIANIVTPLFGGIPATGVIARTATNIRNGAVSPVSGMVHSLFVLAVLLMFFSYAAHIPLASMAPILMVVAWNMSERKEFAKILKHKDGDSLVLIITFILTVAFDLVVGVTAGLAAAFFLFAIKMGRSFAVRTVLPQDMTKRAEQLGAVGYANSKVQLYILEGPLFFGSAKHLQSLIQCDSQSKIWIFCMDKVPYIDSTGEQIFTRLVRYFQQKGGMLVLAGLQEQPKRVLQQLGVLDKIKGSGPMSSTGIQERIKDYIDVRKAWVCLPLSG